MQYPSVPAVEVPPITPKKKFKYKDCNLDYEDWFGYDSYNKCGPFFGAVAGEEGCDRDKDIPDSMMGECRGVNDTRDEADKLVSARDSKH